MLKGTSSSLAQLQGFHVVDVIPLPCPRWQAYKGEKYGYIASLKKGYQYRRLQRVHGCRRSNFDLAGLHPLSCTRFGKYGGTASTKE